MKAEEMRFFGLERWKGNEIILHGFGTRGRKGEDFSREDWRGESLQEGGKAFPLITLHQVHGDRGMVWNGGPQTVEDLWSEEGDALITRISGYAISVLTADCLPILLFDPVQRAIGIVHAGWRGTAKATALKAVGRMEREFRCRPEDIQAALGPCIGACCYEVDKPVKEAFAQGGVPWDRVSLSRGGDKWFLSLHQANECLLRRAGLREENIFSLGICTCCNREIFWSYRAEGKIRGEQLSFIALR